ncbi:MAG: hypothetical protein IPJ65_19755 [Archangiaceae bacterium]|nr:hypothetical protein [Archangiaceae bacterium]
MKAIRLAAVLGLAACGPANAVHGTIDGHALAVEDAILFVQKDTSGKILGTAVILSDQPALCSTFKANRFPRSSTFLSMGLARRNGTEVLLTPEAGEYTVSNTFATQGSVGTAFFGRLDANCVNAVPFQTALAKSGLVTLQQISFDSNGGAGGTFDLSFGSDRVTGSFSVPYCEGLAPTTMPSCE